jgi:hypothetical protein
VKGLIKPHSPTAKRVPVEYPEDALLSGKLLYQEKVSISYDPEAISSNRGTEGFRYEYRWCVPKHLNLLASTNRKP